MLSMSKDYLLRSLQQLFCWPYYKEMTSSFLCKRLECCRDARAFCFLDTWKLLTIVRDPWFQIVLISEGPKMRILRLASLVLFCPTRRGCSRMFIPGTLLVCPLIPVSLPISLPISVPIFVPVRIPLSVPCSVCMHFLFASFLSHLDELSFLVFEDHP